MKYYKLIILLLFTSVIFSQSNSIIENPFIEVVGKSEKEIIPDEIYIDILIRERIVRGKKQTIDILENQLKNELKKIKIPESNLSISDVNAFLAKTGWWKEEVLSTANYTLKVNDVDKLKKLFNQFDKLKISEVNITKATHSNIETIKKENRIAAIKAAKEKADYLLTSIGQKTGKPIKINELNNNNNNNHQNYVMANNMNNNYAMSKIRGIKNETIQFQKIKITSSIYAKFSIK
ncbi:hypothetical protein OD91_2074 [Lutibacter sp. Hel_I_33_5]|uniref:SIMPL domain-containing protein n=1 Tax=Lutibacter sp. Hel_I_33_5 TaxID=1566289 RepID=UPI0011A908D8|nr:SIMPL domain-containing protein [Lutibacter sp. Hel_I_33_5]TVZ56776.1 hypothetical protein OD91_2074 [Lutibacter sp. Hel_I_33_5]